MRGNNRSGSILVFILAILMMLSVLCVRLMEETVQELKYVSQPYHRKELRMHAYSWLEATVGIMNQANIYRGQVRQAPFFNLYELYSDPVKYLQEQGITSARLFPSIDGESEDFISPIDVNVSVRIENEKLPSNLSEKGLKALFAFMYSEITNLCQMRTMVIHTGILLKIGRTKMMKKGNLVQRIVSMKTRKVRI